MVRMIRVTVIAVLLCAIVIMVGPKIAMAADCGLAGWIFGCDTMNQGTTQAQIAADTRAKELELEQSKLVAQQAQAQLDAQNQARLAMTDAELRMNLANLQSATVTNIAAINASALKSINQAGNQVADSSVAMNMMTGIVVAQMRDMQLMLYAAMIGIIVAMFVIATIFAVHWRRRTVSAPTIPYGALMWRSRLIRRLEEMNTPYTQDEYGVSIYHKGAYQHYTDAEIHDRLRALGE